MRVYNCFLLPSVLKIKGLDPLAAVILGHLLAFSHKTKSECFYQLEKCGADLNISRNRARRLFKQLEAEKLIFVFRSPKLIKYSVNWKHPAIVSDMTATPETDLNDGFESDPSIIEGVKSDGFESDPSRGSNQTPKGCEMNPSRGSNRTPLIQKNTDLIQIKNEEASQSLQNDDFAKSVYPASVDEVHQLMAAWVDEHVKTAAGQWAAYLDLDLQAEGFFSYWSDRKWMRGKKPMKSIQGSIARWLGNDRLNCERLKRMAYIKPQNTTEFKRDQINRLFGKKDKSANDPFLIEVKQETL